MGCFSVLKHVPLHEGHESLFVGDWRHAGDAPLLLVQEPCLGEGLALLVAVPGLKVVDDRYVINVPPTLTQELMSAKLILMTAKSL